MVNLEIFPPMSWEEIVWRGSPPAVELKLTFSLSVGSRDLKLIWAEVQRLPLFCLFGKGTGGIYDGFQDHFVKKYNIKGGSRC